MDLAIFSVILGFILLPITLDFFCIRVIEFSNSNSKPSQVEFFSLELSRVAKSSSTTPRTPRPKYQFYIYIYICSWAVKILRTRLLNDTCVCWSVLEMHFHVTTRFKINWYFTDVFIIKIDIRQNWNWIWISQYYIEKIRKKSNFKLSAFITVLFESSDESSHKKTSPRFKSQARALTSL